MRTRSICTVSTLFIMICAAVHAHATSWYVSPTGTATNAGTQASPWSLAYAFSGAAAKIKPGDTVYLKGGTYTGLFRSSLTGTAAAPIVVMSAPGEWAIVDGAPFTTSMDVAIEVNGAYTTYRDFEVMNSNPDRPVAFPYRPATLNVYGPNTKFINMLVHDGGQGIGLWTQAQNAEVYGCLIFNNGGEERDHGIYTQNDSTTKLISDNVIFNSAGYAIHAYGSGSTVPLANYTITGNTIVNDSSIIGNRPVKNLVYSNNYQYGGGVNFGYTSSTNDGALIENNWFATTIVDIFGWKNAVFRNNKFWKFGHPGGALINITFYPGYALTDYVFTKNTHYQFDAWDINDYRVAYPTGSYGYKFNDTIGNQASDGTWQGTLGYDNDGTYIPKLTALSNIARPSGTEIFTRVNKYDTSRTLVTIYNWDGNNSVSIPASQLGLVAGDTYELRNALNYSNESETKKYDGKAITIDMTRWSVAPSVGLLPALTNRPNPFPDFGVFVLNKISAGTIRPSAPLNLRLLPSAQ